MQKLTAPTLFYINTSTSSRSALFTYFLLGEDKQCDGDPPGRMGLNNDPLKSQWTPVVPPLPLCAPPLLSSCSGGLIMKTEMLCQRYCTHAIPFTSLLRTSKPLTHQQDGKQGMHIRQLIQLEMLTPVSPSATALWDKMGGRQGRRGEERRGKENRGTEKEGGSILTTQRSARMLVVGPTATVFLIDDLCWIDTFCWGPKHAASPQRLAFVNQ